MTDLKAHLDRIRESMPKLNQVSDDAANLVRILDKSFHDWGVGVEASALFSTVNMPSKVWTDSNDEEHRIPVEKRRYLVYERIAGDFRIGVSEQVWVMDVCDQDELQDENTYDWSSADRPTKLASFGVLPALIGRVAEVVEETASKVAKTTETVGEMVAAITPRGKAPKTAHELCDEDSLVEWFEAQGISPANARQKARAGLIASIKHSDLPLGLSGVQELIDLRVA